MSDKYQNFLSKLQQANESDRDWLVMEFSLEGLSETLRQAVWAAAIPHWFDHDFLNHVLNNPLKGSDFEALTELSFVEKYPERGFNIHERNRKLLLDKLWSDNNARYQRLSKRAAAYCKKQNLNDTTWCVEMLYHELSAKKTNAKDNFIKQGMALHDNFQYDDLENLTQVVLEAVNRSKLTPAVGALAAYWQAVEAFAAYWQAKIELIYNRYPSAQDFLQLALKQSPSEKLTANCTRTLGDAHKFLAEYEQAQDYYQRALKVHQKINNYLGEANCIQAIGEIHMLLTEHSQARDCYQRALAIYKRLKRGYLGEANCIQALGDVHKYLAEYDQALDCYNQSLKIYQQIKDSRGMPNCFHAIGVVYSILDEYDQAQDYFQQALTIYQQIRDRLGEANCIRSLGDVYQSLAKYDQAKDCYQQALTFYQQAKCRLGEANCFESLGCVYGEQQHMELAVTNIQQAAQIFEEIGDKKSKASCFNVLGVLYMCQKQFESALMSFNQAIEIFSDDVDWYQSRAELYIQMSDYEKAEADIKKVESIGIDFVSTLFLKAKLALMQRQEQQAKELYQQASSQRPAKGVFRALFALILFINGQTQLAYSEMELALKEIYRPYDFDNLLDTLNKLEKIYGYLPEEVDILRGQILRFYQTDFMN